MTFTVSRTIPGKYSGMDHTGKLYFTDDEEAEFEKNYYYEMWLKFKLGYVPDEDVIEFAKKLVDEKNIPILLEECNEEQQFMDFILGEEE